MKIIISRKGFDAENGGMASPIMPDGTTLSFPIPSGDSDDFTDLVYHGKTYEELIEELKPDRYFGGCHIDPDIRPNAHKKLPKGWKPVFGQCSAAETHLENKGVEVGDLFLFFGWFKQTEEVKGNLKYKKGAKDIHAIYGYLQIGKIAKGKETLEYDWHPHCYVEKTNTMYVASDHLVIDGVDTGLPGAGTLKFSDEVVLTYPGMPKSRWKLPEFFKDVEISCHSKSCFKPEGYFQSVRIGQEFVVSESAQVTQWAKDMILHNVDMEGQSEAEEYIPDTLVSIPKSKTKKGKSKSGGLSEEEIMEIVDRAVDEYMEELEAEWEIMDRAEELDENEIPEVTKIYFDMDSVLADFERGVREICEMEPPTQNGTPNPERDDEMWRKIKESDHFYDRLELMPDAKELFDAVYSKYGDKCEILTGVPKPKRGIETAGEDKIKWVRRLLSKDVKVNIVLREEKKNYCTGKGCILIDDMEKNILEWKEMGGSGFMHVTANHTLYRLEELKIV